MAVLNDPQVAHGIPQKKEVHKKQSMNLLLEGHINYGY